MKRLNIRTAIITNAVLLLTVLSVLAVSFIPTTALPTYGRDTVSAIYHGNRENRKISIMFNVYENTKIVEQIVDCLDRYGAKSTFFVGGCWADDNGETLQKIVSSGHEIANHGYFHKDHKKLDYKGNYDEISLTGKIVEALCGVRPVLFAPPSGSFSAITLESAYDLDYKVVMWSKDTIDWRDSDQNLIINRATKNVANGDLVLMHPKKHTLSALPTIIEYYINAQFKIVTVSDNLM